MWRVRLFDGPDLEDAEGRPTSRFRSVKVQSLLAFLALRLGRRCPREEIADALWPEEPDAAVTANRLRVTLASLRRQLEPPGTPFGSVLDASIPGSLRLRSEAVWCDVEAFERALAAGRKDEAAVLMRGPLLPGLYDEWVRDAQLRFESLREGLSGLTPAAPETVISDAPPAARHRLPLYLTRFVGRQKERRQLRERLADSRLVTLTGPGGIGKTRLAVETAAEGEIPAVFASLAGMEGVAEAVLQAFGISSRSADEPMAQLLEVVVGRPPALLILDNAEDVVDEVAELVPRLLAAAPGLRALVTSRQRLEVPGEAVLPVPTLDAPPEQIDAQQLAEFPSADLFLDRARAAVPDFTLRDRYVDPIVSICRRLEGMPLALELAAARVAVQSPAGIAASLEANMMDLRSRQRGLSERHRSLRAAIQGSVEMLSPELQRFFARLSVFRDGWTTAAAAVVGDEPQAEAWLEELAVRSLIQIGEDGEGEPRYDFLGPIRAFAAETLTPDERVEAARLHADYYLSLAAQATEDDVRTLRPLDEEEENLRLAVEAGADDPAQGMGLAGALIHAFVRGRHRPALRWIEGLAERVDRFEDPFARFWWRYAACQILPDVGHLDEAEALTEAMRADAESMSDERGRVYADLILSYVVEHRGGLEAALALSESALARARELGDRHLLETCLSHRSGALHVRGEKTGPGTEPGKAELAEAEALARELRSIVPPWSRRLALGPLLLAAALWPQGRLTEAYASFKEAQAAAVRLGTTTELMYGFVSEAAIAAEWGRLEHAAVLYGAFEQLQERMGYSLERAQSSRPPWIEAVAARLREGLGEARFGSLVEEGRRAPAASLARTSVAPGENR